MKTPISDDFAARFAAALGARDLSLDGVRVHLAKSGYTVSVATLSYWRSGRSVPWRRQSLEMVGHLESLLGVPTGFLSDVLPTHRRQMWNPTTAIPLQDRARERIDQLAGELALTWLWRGIDDILFVEGPGSPTRVRSKVWVEAKTDGAQELPIVLYPDGLTNPTPSIEALEGCEVARLVPVEGTHILFATLALAQPLKRGQRTTLSYEASFDGDHEQTQTIHRASRNPLDMLSLTVIFGGDVPVRFEASGQGPTGVPIPFEPATLNGNQLTSINFDLPIGTYRIDCHWA